MAELALGLAQKFPEPVDHALLLKKPDLLGDYE